MMKNGNIGKKFMKYQIALTRDTSLCEDYITKNFSSNNKISSNVRDFHRNMLKNISDHNYNVKNWQIIFKDSLGEYISYYRIDSYLLADAPIAFKPVMGLLTPSINNAVGYYGVDSKGVELLIKNHVFWPEFLHISKYEVNSDTQRFINNLCDTEFSPYYINMLEDSLATYWISNIYDKEKDINNLKEKTNSFLKSPLDKDLDFFINEIYYPYVKNTQIMNSTYTIENLFENIPESRVEGASPLDFRNLKSAVKERFLKIMLFDEVLDSFDVDTDIINIEQLRSYLDALYTLTENYHKETNQKIKELIKKKIANITYKFWQKYGAFWSYSEGNVVDFSLRDELTYKTGNIDPEETADLLPIPTKSKFLDTISNTDIDATESIIKNADKRKKILEYFFNHAKDIGHVEDYWMLLLTKSLHHETEKEREKAIERINGIYKSERIKMGEIVYEGGSFTAGILMKFIPILNSMKSIQETIETIYSLKKKINSYCTTNLPYFKIEDVDKREIKTLDTNSWRKNTINLPYKRSRNIDLSGQAISGIGYSSQ